jgi:hypothetical protein
LDKPKITDQELHDIQKFASSGIAKFGVQENDDATSRKSGATQMLLDTRYSVKDELLSTIENNKSMLGKRPRVTSDKLMKDAQDALVFKNSQSALLGGENPKLNFELQE